MSESTEIAVITPEAARSRAMAKVKKYQDEGALIYVKPEDLQTQGMFFAVPTVIRCTENDFHKISGGKLQPKAHHTQLIARATGTSIVEASTRKDGEFVWVGNARGHRRMPDGTNISAVAEYEFDAEKRAEEDFIKDAGKYPDEAAKRKHVLELARFARARAETGASLRVIRKLAGIPTAFERHEIDRAMVFARIELNTDLLLSNPATATAAIQAATGAKVEIYGPEPRAALEAPAATEPEEIVATVDENGDDIPFGDAETQVDILRRWFETTATDESTPADARAWIKSFLAGEYTSAAGQAVDSRDEATLVRYKAILAGKIAAKGGVA